MKTKKNQIPKQIPVNCTERFNVRIPPWRKEWMQKQADRHKISMSKVWLHIMDLYLENNLSFQKIE